MKNVFIVNKIAILCLLCIGMLQSCKKDFLEINPKGKLIAQTTDDYYFLLNNNDLFNVGTSAQLLLGDEVAAVEPFFSSDDLHSQRLFRYNDVVYEPNEDANELTVPMQNLYTYNKIINEVGNSSGGTDQRKQSIKAEALAGRAWTNFMLINYFAKPYRASSAPSDPGFPIVQSADVTATRYSRASVQEVYDYIISDLKAAIPNLPVGVSSRNRMSRAAAEGILAKVYVFMGRFSEALPLLDNAIADIGSSSLRVGLYNYNVTLGLGGSFLPVDIFGPQYPTASENEECIYARQFSNFWVLSSDIVIKPATVALYSNSDLRLQFYSNTPFPFGAPYPSGMLRRMGPITIQYGLTLPDVYLLRAECRARLNQLPEAVQDVEYLRKNRMAAAEVPVPSPVASQQLPLINFILEERIREFSGMGYRWFDMRRLSVDPLFSNNNYSHFIYSDTGTATQIALKSERFALRFPDKIILQNPGMQNNP